MSVSNRAIFSAVATVAAFLGLAEIAWPPSLSWRDVNGDVNGSVVQGTDRSTPGIDALLRKGFRRVNVEGRSGAPSGPFVLTAGRLERLARRFRDDDRERDAEVGDDNPPCGDCTSSRGGGPELLHVDQTPPPVTQFTANLSGGDPQIAASTTHLVVTLRHEIHFFDKSGGSPPGTPLQSIHGKDFFAPLYPSINTDLNLPDGFDPSDPSMQIDEVYDARVIFDRFRRRFWIAALAHNKPYDNAGQFGCITVETGDEDELVCVAHREKFVLAVSLTENPQDGWLLYWWDAILNDACSGDCTQEPNADYPSIGISEKFFVQENTAGIKNPTKDRKYYRRIVTVDADVLATGSACSGCWWAFGDFAPNSLKQPNGCEAGGGAYIQPAVHHTPSPNLFYLASMFTFDGTTCGGAVMPPGVGTHNVALWVVYFPNPQTMPQFFNYAVAVHPYSTNLEDADQPPAPNPSDNFDEPNLVRFGNVAGVIMKAVYRGGHVYGTWVDCFDSDDADTDCETILRLFRANVANASDKLDEGFGTRNPYDDGPTDVVHYGNPALEVNKDGDVAVVYTRSGRRSTKPVYPEARFSIFRQAGLDVLASRVLQAGDYPLGTNVPAEKPIGQLDTGGAAVDPFDDRAIWMAHKYSTQGVDGNGVPIVAQGGYRLVVGKIFGRTHPDLVPTFLTSITPHAAGTELHIDVQVTNHGDGPAKKSSLNVYWSPDPLVSSLDPLLGVAAVGPLASGGQQTISLTVTVPKNARRGVHHLIGWADAGLVVNEYADDNNFDQAKVRVVGKN